MALIDKTGISNGSTIDASHITRIIDALDGTSTTATVIATGSFSGSFKGILDASIATASFATYAATAGTASYIETAQTASYVVTAQTASYVATASYVTTSATASHVQSSNVFGPHGANSVTSASYAKTASYVDGLTGFSEIVVGGTTISADQQSDTLTLVAGTNITLTPNATNDSITIAAAGGGGGSTTNAFATMSVGSTHVIANSTVGAMSFVAGTGISISANASNDTITITNTGGGGGGAGSVSTSGTTLYSTNPASASGSGHNIFLGSGAGLYEIWDGTTYQNSINSIALGRNAGTGVIDSAAPGEANSISIGLEAGRPEDPDTGTNAARRRANTISIGTRSNSNTVTDNLDGTIAIGLNANATMTASSTLGNTDDTPYAGIYAPLVANNIIIGTNAARAADIGGARNIIMGFEAMAGKTVVSPDSDNIAIGSYAVAYGDDVYGRSGTVAIGAKAGVESDGRNVMIGYYAGRPYGYDNAPDNGIAIGPYTAFGGTSGYDNYGQIVIGYNIGLPTSGDRRAWTTIQNGFYMTTLKSGGFYNDYGTITDGGSDTEGSQIDRSADGNAVVGIGRFPDESFTLSVVGDAQKPTSAWTVSSDIRLKENIEEANYETCYNIINSLPLKRYTWKNEAFSVKHVSDRSKLGWIAQEVETIFPKAVKTTEFHGSGSYDASGSFSGFYLEDCKTLDADQIYAAMYGTIKYLIAENNTLKLQVSASNADIAAIKTHLGL